MLSEEQINKIIETRFFLYLRKEFKTPLHSFIVGMGYWTNNWADFLGISHEDFLEKYENDEYFQMWFNKNK